MVALRLFLVRRTDESMCDETVSAVVCATNWRDAVVLCGKLPGDQRPNCWWQARVTDLGEARPNIDRGIVLESFNSC